MQLSSLIVADQDPFGITPWEIAFIVLAAAFTLEEYTAATEHGWISKRLLFFLVAVIDPVFSFSIHSQCKIATPFLSVSKNAYVYSSGMGLTLCSL